MKAGAVTQYIASHPPVARRALRQVRATILKALPRATEGISYQIPVYKLDGRMVLFFAGFRQHYSIYPASPRLVRALGRDLDGRLRNKTIRFALEAKVPTRLIARIARMRAAEVMEAAKAR